MQKITVILFCLFLVACNSEESSDSPAPPPETGGGQWNNSNWDGFEWQ